MAAFMLGMGLRDEDRLLAAMGSAPALNELRRLGDTALLLVAAASGAVLAAAVLTVGCNCAGPDVAYWWLAAPRIACGRCSARARPCASTLKSSKVRRNGPRSSKGS